MTMTSKCSVVGFGTGGMFATEELEMGRLSDRWAAVSETRCAVEEVRCWLMGDNVPVDGFARVCVNRDRLPAASVARLA